MLKCWKDPSRLRDSVLIGLIIFVALFELNERLNGCISPIADWVV